MRIGIIGGGRVGSCLAGYLAPQLAGITARSREHGKLLAEKFGVPLLSNAELVERAELLLITVPDRLIAQVAESLASQNVAEKIFLHASGSLGVEELAALAAAGAHTGSLHPLQSFAGGATKLEGVYMAVDGDEIALAAAEKIARQLGGRPFRVPPAERAAYHAAACIASNYAVTVEALAQRLVSRWLGDEEAAWQALLPLFQGTAANLARTSSPISVLTGPIARGDAGTIAKHLEALPPEFLPVYRSLALATTELARADGRIDKDAAAQMLRLLER